MKKITLSLMIALALYTPCTRPQIGVLDLVAIWLTCTCVTQVAKLAWGNKHHTQERIDWIKELNRQRHLLRQYCLLMQKNQHAFEQCNNQHAALLELAHKLRINLENHEKYETEAPLLETVSITETIK